MKKSIILPILIIASLGSKAGEDDSLSLSSFGDEKSDTLSIIDTSNCLTGENTEVTLVSLNNPIKQEEYTSNEVVMFLENKLPINEELFNFHVSTKEFSIPMVYNNHVRAQIHYFGTRWQSKLKEMVTKSQYFFPYYEEVLNEFNMPLEIKYLSVIESSLNPYAYSRVGAAGAWQFMPATGRIFDLNQNRVYDERRSVEKSTRAACTYLQQMYNMYGDWLVALAAYNCGPGNVRKAMRYSGKKDFWGMYNYLPRETKNYVPKFIAMAYMMNFYSEYGITPVPYEGKNFEYDRVFCQEGLHFSAVSDLLGLTDEELRRYNPELSKPTIPYKGNGYELNIPEGYSEVFYSNVEGMLVSSKEAYEKERIEEAKRPKVVYHYVRKGECLPIIARRHGCTVSQLKKWNGIRGSIIYPKQKLKIYRS